VNLGILVTSDEHLDHVIGLVKAATSKALNVTLFCMDRGTLLLEDPKIKQLCKLDGVEISLCRHSAEGLGVDTNNIQKDIVCGSQFNNAMMNHDADKVIVL
jgi:predicted peroxiredoxin